MLLHTSAEKKMVQKVKLKKIIVYNTHPLVIWPMKFKSDKYMIIHECIKENGMEGKTKKAVCIQHSSSCYMTNEI